MDSSSMMTPFMNEVSPPSHRIESLNQQIVLFDLNEPATSEPIIDLNSMPLDLEHDMHMNDEVDEVDILCPENEEYWRKLEFATIDSCKEFYKEYAKEQGFSVRKQYARIGLKSEIPEYVLLTCNKAGYRKNSVHNPNNQTTNPDESTKKKRPIRRRKVKIKQVTKKTRTVIRAETRTGCEAHMYLRCSHKKKIYYIDRWAGIHNHTLHEKADSFMLRCNRQITETQALFAETAQRAGLGLRSSYELMCIQAGGRDCLGFLKQDLKNHLNRRRQKDMKRGEGTKLLEHFRERAFASPLFYYDVEVDSQERIANIFWADERMRMDYASFGDVVTFDTTFRTNKAYRPLAVFIGFNHHRETCVYGVALLWDETAESFKWLFHTFLRCNEGKHPRTIFTDQDAAMAVAIPQEFPYTYHGLCTWHIMQNGAKNMGSKFNKTFIKNLNGLMYDVESEQEFQILWDQTISMVSHESGSDGHWWLKRIYHKRRQWSWAWMRHQFTAGIRSTQLVESFNSTIKDFLQSDLHIDEFFAHFDRMIENTRMRERQSDFDAIEKLRKNDFPNSSIVNHAARVYTDKIFDIFHRQYNIMLSYRAVPLSSIYSGNSQSFKVFRFTNGVEHDERDVLVDTKELELRCSCLMFENFGVLCCHILRVMDLLGSTCCESLLSIPDKYILKRWTLKAKVNGAYMHVATNLSGNNVAYDPHQVMVMKLLKLASQACSRADFHDKIAPDVDKLCNLMDKIVMDERQSQNIITISDNGAQDAGTTSNPVLRIRENPIKARRRLKSGVELRKEEAKKRAKECIKGMIPSCSLLH